jgi:hypothetical protein
MARPVKGPELVDDLEGEQEAKRRLKVILAQISGEQTVAEAMAELGLGRSTFFELRSKVLQSALAGLAPKPRGRPAAVAERDPEADAAELARLRAEYDRQLTELQIANVREELRLVMPEVVLGTPELEADKKKRRNRRKRQRRRQR